MKYNASQILIKNANIFIKSNMGDNCRFVIDPLADPLNLVICAIDGSINFLNIIIKAISTFHDRFRSFLSVRTLQKSIERLRTVIERL